MDECLFEADIEKELGNVAYNNKNFADALKHYKRAVYLNPNNIVYRNNIGAVYFEQGYYLQCISECKEAIKIGQDNGTECKHLAKSYARIGNAYLKLDNLTSAVEYFRSSLLENYDKNIHKKLQELEARSKYNPNLSNELKCLGNESFNKGEFPQALGYYTEALKHNPLDPSLFSNRAASYAKLLEFKAAAADCDSCLALDHSYVKAHIRKGLCCMALRDYTKAEESFITALELDPESQEALDGFKRCWRQKQLNPDVLHRQAMADPEVQCIMRDPIIQKVLKDMQVDPMVINSHLKSPEFAKKIEKLVEFGLVAIR